MRLIDADALEKSFCEWCGNAQSADPDEVCGRTCATLDFFDEQPTVEAEPVRHGYWHGYWIIRGGDMWCSECGYGDVTEFGEPEDYRYCPNCGADMAGGKQDG